MIRKYGSVAVVALLLTASHAEPATLAGIPLGTFLGEFTTFVTGLGLTVGVVGLVGYIGSLMDNPFSNILAGSVGFFTKAGLLGGGTAIMTGLGLVGGATL